MSDVTLALAAVHRGEPGAAARLLPLVYDELRKLAALRLQREPAGQTLDPTALVHEAYLRVEADGFDHRGHFFAAAAEAMRRILVDNARRKKAAKHGGHLARHDAAELAIAAPQADDDLLALDAALTEFAEVEPEKAELVKLRHFAGLTIDEAAEALGISPATAKRWWAYSRAWLFRKISGENP